MNKKKTFLLYKILRFIGTPFFKLYFSPKIIGKEKIIKDGSLLLVGNHIHALDPLLVDICTNRVVHTLAKSELFKGKFGFFFKKIGAISVDLKKKKNPDALTKAISFLKDGKLVNVSPEAARNYTDELLLPFKKGAVIMSKETNTLILPYCIIGDYKFRSNNLKIIFGDYLDIRDKDIEEANQILFEEIKDLLLKHKYE